MRMISSLSHLVDIKTPIDIKCLNVPFFLAEAFTCGACLVHQWLGKWRMSSMFALRYHMIFKDRFVL